jgi:hypothetical protein
MKWRYTPENWNGLIYRNKRFWGGQKRVNTWLARHDNLPIGCLAKHLHKMLT